MACCPECFGDKHLELEIIPELSREQGTCSYCGSQNQPLVEPTLLREQFELLTSIYVECETEGKTLAEWLKEDWALFSHPRMDNAHAKELLGDILDDGERVRKRFIPSDNNRSDALERWEALRSELMHTNRYFPKIDINLERLKRLFSFLLLREEDVPAAWFRARIQQGSDIIPIDEMREPPKHLASHGRANPAGIPYLYLASTELTAASEVRPHTGELMTIAQFRLAQAPKITDLRHPRKTVSPFVLSDENEIALLRGDIEFLEKLGDELTRPVLPRSAAFDYIPSQYLCEFVKNCGFDGVMYRSSVGDGVNFALFHPELAEAAEVQQHEVSRVSVDIAPSDDHSQVHNAGTLPPL